MERKTKTIIILILLAGIIGSLAGIYNGFISKTPLEKLLDEEFPIEKEGNLRCNEVWDGDKLIERNCRSSTESKTEFSSENYIQASHYDIWVRVKDEGLIVKDVDYCRITSGDSMQPTHFTDNTVCFIEYKQSMKNKLTEGLIIEYSVEGKKLSRAHRIKAIYSDYIKVQGDNSDYSETVEYENILGISVVSVYT